MTDDDRPRGRQVVNDPHLNRGTAFTAEERERLGLTGLLPPGTQTLADQVARVLENSRRKPSDLERYIFLMALLDRNEVAVGRAALETGTAEAPDHEDLDAFVRERMYEPVYEPPIPASGGGMK